jgi:proline racemase
MLRLEESVCKAYLIKDLYVEYIKTSQNSIIKIFKWSKTCRHTAKESMENKHNENAYLGMVTHTCHSSTLEAEAEVP